MRPRYGTIDPDEIMDERQPELVVTVKDPYSRFRYESEKNKEPKRNRRVDYDDPEKQCLAEVQVCKVKTGMYRTLWCRFIHR